MGCSQEEKISIIYGTENKNKNVYLDDVVANIHERKYVSYPNKLREDQSEHYN